MNKIPRINATEEALTLLNELTALHGQLIIHQSGGCCDGSSPMCFSIDDFRIGYSDVGLGYIGSIAFWMSKDQFEYWKHTRLTLDVVVGRGSSFSLEIPTGKRFIIRSELFKPEELEHLEDLFYKTD
ncbi:MAG: DUF779 domain-containing protein [Flavobacteriales bacterium]|nr:DUF779 domain-containing protein [Flavobacteriales bacterium]